MFIMGGVYDSYESPHYNSYYSTTKAANAITFRYPQANSSTWVGQAQQNFWATGKIVHFETNSGYDIVTGDATSAYNAVKNNTVTQVLRSIAYLRGINQFLVFDRVVAPTPLIWEWNIHALQPFSKVTTTNGNQSNSTYQTTSGNTTACVSMIYPSDAVFSQQTGYTVPPSTPYTPQTQAQWETSSAVTSATFVAALNPDCSTNPVPAVQTIDGGETWVFEYQALTFVFDSTGLQVQQSSSSGAVDTMASWMFSGWF